MIKTTFRKRAGIIALLSLFLISTMSPPVAALEGTPSFDEEFYAGNDVLFYDPRAVACAGSSSPGTPNISGDGTKSFATPGELSLKGANNAEKVMNFLLEQGFPLPAASGIMGNFSVESGFDPTALNSSSGAFGLAQWLGSRKTNLQEYGGSAHNTLPVQVQFLMHELQTDEQASMVVKQETDPVQAAITWELKFERSGEVAVSERSNRARKIFDEWTQKQALSDSFLRSIGSGSSGSGGGGGGTGGGGNCGPSGAGSTIFGTAELEGYAFPIAVTSKSDIDTFDGALNRLPCTGTCHHDGTYAFDLGVKGYGARDPIASLNPNSIGAPVYAISDGTITIRHDNPNAVRTNCTQFTLRSSKDNHSWWYGHLMLEGAAVDQGQTVKAGQLLGYVGPSNCADNTAPHLHIDSGGGSISRRDDLVSKVVNGLYNQIGE